MTHQVIQTDKVDAGTEPTSQAIAFRSFTEIAISRRLALRGPRSGSLRDRLKKEIIIDFYF